MTRFFCKLALMLIVLWTIDNRFAAFLDTGRPPDYLAFVDSKLSFNAISGYDVVAFGDSHVADALNPRMFQAETGLSLFNFGVYHASPYEIEFLVRDVLGRTRRRPKLALLGTNPIMFSRPASAGKYTALFLSNPFIRSELLWGEPRFSPAAFTSAGLKMDLLPSALRALYAPNQDYVPTRVPAWIENGYLANTRNGEVNATITPPQSDLREEQVRAFAQIIAVLKKRKIEVVIVHPPLHPSYFDAIQPTDSFRKFQQQITELVTSENLLEFNAENEIGNHGLSAEHFLDSQHLCLPGAEIFTQHLTTFVARSFPEVGSALFHLPP